MVVPVTSPPTHVPLGTSIYDIATLSGQVGSFSFAGGTITFNFYSSIDCTGTPAAETGVGLTAPIKSSNHGPLAAGSYSFAAKYVHGTNTNYTDSDLSSCEPFIVDPAKPSAATELHKVSDDWWCR